MVSDSKFNSFKEFYPFYLSEHDKSLTKIFHAIGSLGVLAIILDSKKKRLNHYLHLFY